MEGKKHLQRHKSCDRRKSKKMCNNDDLFKKLSASNIKQCNSALASPWQSRNQNMNSSRIRKHKLHSTHPQSKPILTHVHHSQGDSNQVLTKNIYVAASKSAQTACTRHKTQPFRRLETCTYHDPKTLNLSKLSKKTKYCDHQQYTPAMYRIKGNNVTKLQKNVTFHVTGEPQDISICPIDRNRQFLTIYKSPNVQGPIIKFLTLKKTKILSNKNNNKKDKKEKANKKKQHRLNKTKLLSVSKNVNSSEDVDCYAKTSHLQDSPIEEIDRHLEFKFRNHSFCNATKMKSAKTNNGNASYNLNRKFISKNYLKEELERKRNYSAIFIGSVCVVGKKLTMWKKIKGRMKSLSSLPSRASVARYKKESLDNSVYDKVYSNSKSSDPIGSHFGKQFVCNPVHVCNCKSDMPTPMVESVSAEVDESKVVRELNNYNNYLEKKAVDYSDAYCGKPFYDNYQNDAAQQCDQFPNREGLQDICTCAKSWLRLSCSTNTFLTHLRIKGKEIAKCILGLRQTVSASIQTEKNVNSKGVQKWCADITNKDEKLNKLTRSICLCEECANALPCDECSNQEYGILKTDKKVSCKINERIGRPSCGINVRERTKMFRDTGVMSSNHDTGCRNKKISCDVDKRYKKVEASKACEGCKSLGLQIRNKADKTFAEGSTSCNFDNVEDKQNTKKPYMIPKYVRIASKKDKSVTAVSIDDSDIKSYLKQERKKNAVASDSLKIIKSENVSDTDAVSTKIEIPGIKVHKSTIFDKMDFEQKRKQVTCGTSDLQFTESKRVIQPRLMPKYNPIIKKAQTFVKKALLSTLRERRTRVRHTRLTKSVSVQYQYDLRNLPTVLPGDIGHIGCGDVESKPTAIKSTTSEKCEKKSSNKCCIACPTQRSQSCSTCAPSQKACATLFRSSYCNIRFSNKCMQNDHCKNKSQKCQTNYCKINTCNKSIQSNPKKCRNVSSNCKNLNSLCRPKPRRPCETCAKNLVICFEPDRELKPKTCQDASFQCNNFDSLCILKSRSLCTTCLVPDKLYSWKRKNKFKSIFSQTNVPKPCTCVVELLKQCSPYKNIKTDVQCRRVEIVQNSPCTTTQVKVLKCPSVEDFKCGLPSCKKTETCSLQNIKELITQNPKKCSDDCPHRDKIDHTDPNKVFIHTLRKKPYLSIYRKFPWFYPQFLAILQIWKQFNHILLFCLAICVWTPCILFAELCRMCMCCAFS